ncbi:acyclic terpene utilization AtuA family protein [Comamonas sp. NLF-1-9]|uniref:acyclic terpene utilization AtuA family protein n=1 Tax=Comamonas sp. NLF-1-9 TaxID=2853163 RepID=UPI001C47B1D4|nr:acyclic terpene utilization AtuA family protein [Comamonas sp. NLF-1-9]QXL83520.1 acyclic terpene utilization AtuA family protein [Comamonas sp. NLF-1-9]
MNENDKGKDKVVRIGGASGFWGDSSVGAPQLVASGQVDYLAFDYLAELTMSILAAARMKKPELGYATDFVTVAMRAVLQDVVAKGIRVVSNAGGVNPEGCAAALRQLADELGVSVKIATVTGDDVMPLLPELRAAQPPLAELQSGAPLPAKVVTANAYLGALPVKAALDAGAHIVITGRCVDSAVTLGILMHEFGWQADELDKLAGGSLAGHIIECGCQATGGLHTDWQAVPDWPHIGYPIVECAQDGSFTVTKPAGTGGLIAPQVLAEQMLYEIHDPAAYLLPDVVCDFTQVTMTQTGPERVQVRGARGLPAPASYKVCATWMDGYKTSAQLTIVGIDAVAKARRTGEAIFTRVGELLAARGLAPFTATHIEVLGAESGWGPLASPAVQHTREAVLRISARHADKAALELLAREVAPAGTSWAPGTTGAGGRSGVSPLIRQYAFLLDKQGVVPVVRLDDVPVAVGPHPSPLPKGEGANAPPVVPPLTKGEKADAPPVFPPLPLGEGRGEGQESNRPETLATQSQAAINTEESDTIEVPLIQLAWARSGDKGDTSNIGVIARRPEWLPLLREQVTAEAVKAHLAHAVKGRVTRFEVPGIAAFNFVCEQALGGGGMASLRNDALGKGMAQMLLTMRLRVQACRGVNA